MMRVRPGALLLLTLLAGCNADDLGGAEESAFTREKILAIIAQESPVTYRDGETRLGAFFEAEHRIYVPFAELPKDWVSAIVAAEDANFWTHDGVDPKHVARAVRDNVMAGDVVAGGSTITQQTAKNLFYRPDRSWTAKRDELANALKLEAHFSKEEILEFYANQFHVVGNGRGLGIAARYFFDKTPAQLTLKECAFLAGFVKAPATYNPFIGETEARREVARKAAEDRTSYVLRRLVDVGVITEATRAKTAATPLSFRRGSFQVERSVALDAVERRLAAPDLVQLMAIAGVEDPATAGLSLRTTLDADAQREATWALAHHLAELGPQLEGPIPLVVTGASLTQEPGTPLQRHGLYLARVAARAETLSLDVGGLPCTVDAAGMARVAKMGDVTTLVPGAVVRASVRETKGPLCDLEPRPALQGAVVVLDDGELRAMVGGSDNRNFDRTAAPRQFGSTWKPIVFAAAMQLGWLPSDVLDNRPNVFPFRGVWYAPSADHTPLPWVTMDAAGARSENLASVWLLAHLTDRLSAEQLRRVATLVGLMAGPTESPSAWSARLGKEGITSSAERFEEYAFTQAKADVLAALPTMPHPEDALALRSVVYGRGAAKAKVDEERRKNLWATIDAAAPVVAVAEAPVEAPVAEAAPSEPAAAEVPSSAEVPVRILPSEAGTEAGPPDVAPVAPPVDALILDRLHQSTIAALRAALATRTAALQGRDPWEPEVVLLNPDLRTLIGVRFLQRFVISAGVSTPLPTSLTLPLGAADVSLQELTAVYESFLRGTHPRFSGTGFVDTSTPGLRDHYPLPPRLGPAILGEIRQDGGGLSFRLDRAELSVGDPIGGERVGGILRSVVREGTGKRADGAVKLGGVPLPLAGKTGTTNDFRNAAFLGFAPRVVDGALRWTDGLTVGVYVGYDDNRSMKAGKLRVQGGNGALPVWIDVVRGLAAAGMLGKQGVAEYAASPELGGDPSTGARRFAPLGAPAEGIVEAAPPPVWAEPAAPPTEVVEEVVE